MKVFIISNTLFGYKGINENQLYYFNNIIIPFLEKNVKNGDIFIHGGNIFNNRKNVSMDIIHDVMEIFEKISNILPIYIMKSSNDDLSILLLKRIKNINIINEKTKIDNITLIPYNIQIDKEKNNVIIFNHNYYNNPDTYKNILSDSYINICTYNNDYPIKDDNIINIGSPYELNKNDKNKKGFLVIDTDKKKHKFIENKHSPKFIDINIDKIEDINELKINEKDYIHLYVKESIIDKKENLNKLNLLINKYNFKNITYLNDNNTKENNIKLDNDSFNIKNLINDYLEKNNLNFENELNNIYKIYSEKY